MRRWHIIKLLTNRCAIDRKRKYLSPYRPNKSLAVGVSANMLESVLKGKKKSINLNFLHKSTKRMLIHFTLRIEKVIALRLLTWIKRRDKVKRYISQKFKTNSNYGDAICYIDQLKWMKESKEKENKPFRLPTASDVVEEGMSFLLLYHV